MNVSFLKKICGWYRCLSISQTSKNLTGPEGLWISTRLISCPLPYTCLTKACHILQINLTNTVSTSKRPMWYSVKYPDSPGHFQGKTERFKFLLSSHPSECKVFLLIFPDRDGKECTCQINSCKPYTWSLTEFVVDLCNSPGFIWFS